MQSLSNQGRVKVDFYAKEFSYIFERQLKGWPNTALVRLAETPNPTKKTAWHWAILRWDDHANTWRRVAHISTPGRAGANGGRPGYFCIKCYWKQPNIMAHTVADHVHRVEAHAYGEIEARDLMVAIMEHKP